MRKEKGSSHSSSLQPLALEALRVWKHEVEAKILHSGVMAANYEEREHAGHSQLDHLSAAERKQKRLEALRQQEDARYRVLEQQRRANEAQFRRQNQSRLDQQSQFRRNVKYKIDHFYMCESIC